MIIVESDQIAQGKRVKTGNLIIVGTKKPSGELKTHDTKIELSFV